MGLSFSTALSALSATSTAIDVTGNNLANLDTDGFKTSTVSFHDLVTQSLGAGLGDTQVGFGVGPPVTLRQFSQGAIQTTGGTLDAAIQGDGFFVVNTAGGEQEFTRGGNLQVDQNGNLITATGEFLQGWSQQADGTLTANGPIANIKVPVGTITPPVASTRFSFDLNLNAAGATGDTYSTPITIYDSLGESHVLTATFTKGATAGQWNYSITVPDADLGAAFTPVTGTLQFDSNGQLQSPASSDTMPTIAITGFADGAADMAQGAGGDTSLTWNLYNGATALITQFAQPSSVSALSQNGSAPGQLASVGIANGGQILAQYSNGKHQVVGQLAMASIRNPDSLIAVGNNNYQTSAATALPAIGVPGTGGRGDVLGGAVEASTVDMATEFTNLILFQRDYQAAAKMVTTVDQLSQTTINLKQ